MNRSRVLIRLGLGILTLALLLFVFVPKAVDLRYIDEIVGIAVLVIGIAFYLIEKRGSIR